MLDFFAQPMSSGTLIVKASGQLSEANRDYFFESIGQFINSGFHHIIIDCQRLGHLSSGGLTHLLHARKRAAKAGAKVYLTHLNSNLAEVLELTKLGRILAVFPTNEDAIKRIETQLACVG